MLKPQKKATGLVLVAGDPDPSNADWQRGLFGLYDDIGDVLNAQGNLAGALASYRDSLAP